jgi:hypothetical protein
LLVAPLDRASVGSVVRAAVAGFGAGASLTVGAAVGFAGFTFGLPVGSAFGFDGTACTGTISPTHATTSFMHCTTSAERGRHRKQHICPLPSARDP